MEGLRVLQFLRRDCGYYGCGDGTGTGFSTGFSFGSGFGSGCGTGFNAGNGCGAGTGDGTGDKCGYGCGAGTGDKCGYGDGYGIEELDGEKVYLVDGLSTIFKAIHGNAAKGYILQSDLTVKPCYIVKERNVFAHGDDLRKAMEALRDKLFLGLSEEERIAEFVKEHPEKDAAYSNRDLFDWHNKLTGSCLAGRNAFVKDRGLSLEGQTTVADFIELTKRAYGGTVIQNLKKAYCLSAGGEHFECR